MEEGLIDRNCILERCSHKQNASNTKEEMEEGNHYTKFFAFSCLPDL